jgi:multidrug resistance efflux pump
MTKTGKYRKYGLTGVVVLFAVAAGYYKYGDYVTNPWTRDGQIRADVIQIASRVSAPIVALPIVDNQFVKAGDVLFKLDPRTFETALAQAQANLELISYEQQSSMIQAEANVHAAESELKKNKADYQRQQQLLPRGASSKKAVESAQASYEMSKNKLEAAQASFKAASATGRGADAAIAGDSSAAVQGSRLRLAEAQLRQAALNLEFATITAPVDGYVTGVRLRIGDQVVADHPVLALVDVNSYWVHGFFKETGIAGIRPGDRARVMLMTYPGRPIEGRVESLGWGIARSDGTPSTDLLPSIAPTFEWIRLAQRIPVRVKLIDVPEDVQLRVGSTCSVLVNTGDTDPAAVATGVNQ